MGGRQEAVVKIACIQMEPVVGEKQRNLQKSLALIEEAASQGARLIVLPELCNSGYVFESRDEAFELAEPVPDGPTSRGLERGRRAPRPAYRRRDQRAGRRRALQQLGRDRPARPSRHLPQGPSVERGEPLLRAGRCRLTRCSRRRSGGSAPSSATTAGSPRASGCARSRAPTSSACRPTGCRFPGQDPKREAMANILCMAAAH